jgi:hypothetical protein
MLTLPFVSTAPFARARLPRMPWARRLGLPVEIKPSPRPSEARPNQMFLHVRSVGADGFAHLFQFAIVNADGNVVVSVFARARSPIQAGGTSCPTLPSVWWDQLEEALKPCHGGWLISFGRGLHGGFLPLGTKEGVASLDCARERFLKVARRRGLKVGPGEVVDLNDARRLIGLPPVRSPDAALQALGLRELWRWMDGP